MGDVLTVTVATTVVTTVVGEGFAVRMQEQALLSLDAGKVVAERSRLPFAAGETVVLGRRQDKKGHTAWSGSAYVTVVVALTVGWM